MEGGSAKRSWTYSGVVSTICPHFTYEVNLRVIDSKTYANIIRRYYLVQALKPIDSERVKCPHQGDINMITNKDIMRPIVGTLALQPLALWWAWMMNINYMANLGFFTVVSTLYLIPIYYFYEEIFDGGKANVE